MSEDLTARIAELTAVIGRQLDKDETVANAATVREGWSSQVPVPNWTRRRSDWVYDEDDEPGGYVFGDEVIVYDEGSPSPAQADHIARNDPARALRRVKATRELVAAILAEGHDYNPDDEYVSCSRAAGPDLEPSENFATGSGCSNPDRAGKPCDCGQDARVARLLGIIASEWEETP